MPGLAVTDPVTPAIVTPDKMFPDAKFVRFADLYVDVVTQPAVPFVEQSAKVPVTPPRVVLERMLPALELMAS